MASSISPGRKPTCFREGAGLRRSLTPRDTAGAPSRQPHSAKQGGAERAIRLGDAATIDCTASVLGTVVYCAKASIGISARCSRSRSGSH
jgi:hypothetical protein